MTDVTGSVSVVGINTVVAWVVPAAMLLIVIIAAWAGLRWIRSEHLEALRSVSLFSGLSDAQLMSVLRAARPIEFQPNAHIIEEGEGGKGFFAVTQGTVKVLVDGAEVATLGPGSYFGEIAAIDGGRRTATIAAATRVSTLELTPAAFVRLLDHEAALTRAVAVELRKRLEAVGGLPSDSGTAVDHEALVDLCQRLRGTEHPDWTQAAAPARRLRFSGLFARGA